GGGVGRRLHPQQVVGGRRGHQHGGAARGAGGGVRGGDRLAAGGEQLAAAAEGVAAAVARREGVVGRQDGPAVGGREVDRARVGGDDVAVGIQHGDGNVEGRAGHAGAGNADAEVVGGRGRDRDARRAADRTGDGVLGGDRL